MNSELKIKVCGLTRWEDAELALELGADYCGVIVYPKSPRAATRQQAWELCQRIPAGKRVMVDVNTGADELENWADLGFDHFQIHCDIDVNLATLAAWRGIVGKEQLWLAPKIPPGEAFPQTMLEFADTILVDAYHADKYGGSGQTGNWELFAEWATLYAHKRFVLAGGLNPDNVTEAVRVSGAETADVNSGVESQPGIKDHAKLRALFAALGR
ncbi:phosphoribosylanthranilate isomerase [Cerasicoccus arenae]|uniref:phosphoribosylanthranilate isomerase n=1 Tax=Cerasicoccus arenae TaxID=424488 RepID=UPI001675C65A|nr:phosphoribosylanthranilate isomerase [Cerasicoccus arenae]MBK1857540.1 phosphoribosylanthranilate isomerase [Cerasicoccus arenae]